MLLNLELLLLLGSCVDIEWCVQPESMQSLIMEGPDMVARDADGWGSSEAVAREELTDMNAGFCLGFEVGNWSRFRSDTMISSDVVSPETSGTAAMLRVLTVLGSYMAVVHRAGLRPGLGVADEVVAIILRANCNGLR